MRAPYELERVRELGCEEVPLNGIRTGDLTENGEIRIAIADIHKSTPVAIVFSRTIIVANILTSLNPAYANESMESIEERTRANANNAMELLDLVTNRVIEELNRAEGHIANRLRSHNPYALVVYSRGEAPFRYNNKDLSPVAKPDILQIILTWLDERMGLKNYVTFGSFDVIPASPSRDYEYTPISRLIAEVNFPWELWQGVLHVPGSIEVSPAKGTLVIERTDDRTIIYLEHRDIRNHPAE